MIDAERGCPPAPLGLAITQFYQQGLSLELLRCNMFDVLYREIREHAIEAYPNEACGFIVDGKYIRVGNVSDDPSNEFELSPESWITHGSKAEAFVHSHPDWHPCPSYSDMKHQESSAMPWGIISTNGVDCSPITWFGDQVPREPLVGRGFCHGVTDCYDIIRDWYLINRGIKLKQFPRSWEWWSNGANLYAEGFALAGFKQVPMDEIIKNGPMVGDVFLASVGRGINVINHGGVYVGRGLGLHHLTAKLPVDASRLSTEDPINRWNQYITMWVRYEDAA